MTLSPLFNKSHVHDFIATLAKQILDSPIDWPNLALVGILSAGAPLAQRLKIIIDATKHQNTPIGQLDTALYRDDIDHRPNFVTLRQTDIPFDLENKHLILVDDVLFQGRTIRAALDALKDYGRPKIIQAAVLLDRGHRHLPITADFIGHTLQTKLEDHVEVKLHELDGEDGVYLS